jgi:hypothetical protein
MIGNPYTMHELGTTRMHGTIHEDEFLFCSCTCQHKCASASLCCKYTPQCRL